MGEHAWVIEEEGKVVGYTAVSPVPGLDGVFSLTGAIASNRQRQGLGSRLLAHTLREASQLNMRQLSHSVTDLNSSAAHFLRRHGFFIEHEEWLLQLADFTRLPTAVPPPSCRIQTFPARREAAQQFQSLYDQSFGGKPWHQPYSLDEIEETLNKPADILFLVKANQPIGFAWLQNEAIEPIGVVKGEQGKGYGRFLLHAALHKLKQRGAGQAQIGVWRENETAVRLYQSLGFQHQQTITYLAFAL